MKSSDIKEVSVTRAMRGPDCHTGHYVIKSVFNFQINPPRNKAGAHRRKKFNTTSLEELSTQQRLEEELNSALTYNLADCESPEELWNKMSKDIFEPASNILGNNKMQDTDWFNEKYQEIRAAI